MNTTSFILGIIASIVVAAAAMLFSRRSRTKASVAELRRLQGSDTGDVLADADNRMAHGFFEDAAVLVKAAVAGSPGRVDLKLKLLEIYFIWGKEEEFSEVARQHHSSLARGSEWPKVLVMGQQLCPTNPMFHDAQGGAA